MKKWVSVLCAVVIFLMSLGLSAASAAEAYQVTLSVEFVENLILSKYDVDLYVNGIEQETMRHGKNYNGSFYVPEGDNAIYFYKHGEKGVKGVISLTVNCDMTVSCRITCHSGDITVDKVKILENEPPVQQAEDNVPDEPAAQEEENSRPESSVAFSDIDFTAFTDEELELAAAAIKAEQRARIKTKLVISEENVSVMKGSTVKLTGEVVGLPEGVTASKLDWHSFDKSVATVSQGTITAVNAGTTTISCTSKLSDGTEVYSEVTVTVLVPVSSISLEKDSLSLGLKEEGYVVATVKPGNASNKELIYSSSDPSVAIVSADGVVTPVSVGTTEITVTPADGSKASAKCKVKVSAKSELNIPRNAGKMVLTLTDVKEVKGNYLAKPQSGNTFIVVSYTVENQGSDSKYVTYSDIEGYCNGYKLDVSNTLWICDNYNYLEDLAGGRKIKGEVCMEVPSDWKEIEVRYVPSVWSSDAASFKLYK